MSTFLEANRKLVTFKARNGHPMRAVHVQPIILEPFDGKEAIRTVFKVAERRFQLDHGTKLAVGARRRNI